MVGPVVLFSNFHDIPRLDIENRLQFSEFPTAVTSGSGGYAVPSSPTLARFETTASTQVLHHDPPELPATYSKAINSFFCDSVAGRSFVVHLNE